MVPKDGCLELQRDQVLEPTLFLVFLMLNFRQFPFPPSKDILPKSMSGVDGGCEGLIGAVGDVDDDYDSICNLVLLFE